MACTSLTPFTFPIESVLPRPLGSRGALAGVRCQSPHELAVGSRLLVPLLAAVPADRPRAGCPAPARLSPTPKGSDVLYSLSSPNGQNASRAVRPPFPSSCGHAEPFFRSAADDPRPTFSRDLVSWRSLGNEEARDFERSRRAVGRIRRF
jgi:hypothetical protein